MKLLDLFKLVMGKKHKTECMNCEHDKPATSSAVQGETCAMDGGCCDATGGDCCEGDSCKH